MSTPTPIQDGQKETDSPSRITYPISRLQKGILYGLAVEKCWRDYAVALAIAGQNPAAQSQAATDLLVCLDKAGQRQISRDFWFNFRRINRGQTPLPDGASWYDITPDPMM